MDLRERILELDQHGYHVLEVVTPTGRASLTTASRPCALLAIDGNTYWVKASTQQGLVAELIAGRLAHRLKFGPPTAIVRVTQAAVAAAPECPHLEGIVFGIQDLPGCVNARDLNPFIADGRFDAKIVDGPTRAAATVFQTWIGAGDAQVMVDLRHGVVRSIDHGEVFGTAASLDDPTPMQVPIPGVDDQVGRRMGDLMVAVDAIEALADADLAAAIAGIPSGDPWRSPVDRRAQIGDFLRFRQGRLKEVIRAWAK